MSIDIIEPLLLTPLFKDYLWGGERLAREYGKTANIHPIAESWELSCHEDGLSTVATGQFMGRTLKDVLSENPYMIGENFADSKYFSVDTFPVLIKLIDAKLDLSLQVHPNDEYALKNENSSGKNEFWYVLDADPGSKLLLGLEKPLSRDELAAKICDGSILDTMRTVFVKRGDCFEIPAGLIHAIGSGVLLAEIQQSSNITYRVYDYGRVTPDGKTRQLHIAKATEVTDSALFSKNNSETLLTERFLGYEKTRLTSWDFFKIDRLDIYEQANLCCDPDSFHGLLAVEGELELFWPAPGIDSRCIHIHKGACVFIPAGLGDYTLRGAGQVLLTAI